MRLSILWRIMEPEEGVIRRGSRPRRITPSEISKILHMIRKPNSIIALLFIQKSHTQSNISRSGLVCTLRREFNNSVWTSIKLKKCWNKSTLKEESCNTCMGAWVRLLKARKRSGWNTCKDEPFATVSWGIGISFKDVNILLIAAWNSSEMLLSAFLW